MCIRKVNLIFSIRTERGQDGEQHLACRSVGQYDGAADQVSAAQVLDGLVDVAERVHAGVQLYLAGGGEPDQFLQFRVCADEVADDAELVRDDRGGGDVDLTAVSDQVVAAAAAQHVDRLPGRIALADEVDDCAHAAAADVADGIDRGRAADDGVIGAQLMRHLECLLGDVDGDDLGWGEVLE